MSLAKCQSCAQFVAMRDIRVLDRHNGDPGPQQKVWCLVCVRQRAIAQAPKDKPTAHLETIAANIGGELWEDSNFYLVLRRD